MITTTPESLAEYIAALPVLDDPELTDPWRLDQPAASWYIPAWVWDLPVEEAKELFRISGLLNVDPHL